MRTPIIAGNWKANKTVREALELADALIQDVGAAFGRHSVDIVVCPPFTALAAVADRLRGTVIGVGAQNMYWEPKGAYTGEITPPMIEELAHYVIIGHSERRKLFGETDAMVNKKVQAAFRYNLIPIVAVGEDLAENEAGRTAEIVAGQMRAAFAGVTAEQARQSIVAYEPVWAIGTGRAATPEGANEVIARDIRGTLAHLYGDEIAGAIRVQYGGSVTGKNAREMLSQPDIDGALVGGASLNASDFAAIIRAA